MNPRPLLLACLTALLPCNAGATPAAAELVEKEFQTSMEKWALEFKLADTPDTRADVIARRPDARTYATRMWNAIGTNLSQDWTLEPAAWFLTLTSTIYSPSPGGVAAPAFATEAEAIRRAVETHHIASPKLTPVCFALTAGADPGSLALLQKIEAANPDPQIQGVAAIAAAMVLKSSGDTPELLAKRLTNIRKAIIQSADVEFNGTSVSKIAADELYIIRYLTKGRVAPDLQGTDSAGRPLSLSQFQGKIIVLLFWNTSLAEANQIVSFADNLTRKYQDQSVVILGVSNDPTDTLRGFQADGTIKFPNFSDPQNKLAPEYRIGSLPVAYVLDADRKVSFAGNPGSFVEFAVDSLLSPAAAPESR